MFSRNSDDALGNQSTIVPHFPVTIAFTVRSEELDEDVFRLFDAPMLEVKFEKQTNLPIPPSVGLFINGPNAFEVTKVEIGRHNQVFCTVAETIVPLVELEAAIEEFKVKMLEHGWTISSEHKGQRGKPK